MNFPFKTVRRKTTTTERTEIAFDAKALREALGLPENARIYVRVPGGGDWSSMDLDIGEARANGKIGGDGVALMVEFETTKEEES